MPIEIFIKKLYILKSYIKKIFLSKMLKLDLYLLNISNLIALIKFIKIKFFFSNIIDIIGVDWPAKLNRFEIIYSFLNIYFNLRLFIIIFINENTPFQLNNLVINYITTITSIFQGANWLERENWDMFGILFFNHPDLRRILTDYGFEGFPLRKDFPLTGFLELRYDEEQKSILYEKVELSQEFRFFDFESPWKH